MSIRTCKCCNQSFEADPARPRAQRYCSAECYQRYRKEQTAEFLNTGKPCAACGKLLYPDPERSPSEFQKKRFCSRACRGLNRRNTIEDMASKIIVNATTGCHMWIGPKDRSGYGRIGLNRQCLPVHRVIWEEHHGPIPEDMQIHHTCGVKACCNVDHLRIIGSPEHCLLHTSDNSVGAQNSRKTECPTCGGPFSVWPNGNRYCKPCMRRKQSEYQRKYRSRPGWNAKNTANVARYRANKKERDKEI